MNRPSFPRYILVNEEVFSSLSLSSVPASIRALNFFLPDRGRRCKTPQAKGNNYGHRIESYLQHRPHSSRSFQPSVFAEPANQSGGFNSGANRVRAAYSYPRVIHRSEESPQELLPAASVNNSAAQKVLGMNLCKISPNRENTHRPATNFWARHSTPKNSPSSQAMRWSLTNTQWRTASISRSHYKPFARISQRVF